MEKIFGGPIVPTIFRLVLLSFIVGLILWTFGVDPVNLWKEFGATIQNAWALVFDAIDWAWKYAVIGAIVVLPVWIFYRIMMAVTRPKS